jgi:hypothetical protein
LNLSMALSQARILAGLQFLAFALGVYILAFDHILLLDNKYNHHWDGLLIITIINLLLGGAVLWRPKPLARIVGVWTALMALTIVGDVLLALQLPPEAFPPGSPPFTPRQAFEYLFLSMHGNPVPGAVPLLFLVYIIATIVAFRAPR